MDRRQFLRFAAGAFTVSSLAAATAGCKTGTAGGNVSDNSQGSGLFRFPQGLASGDPGHSSGVFWTRVVRADGVEGDIPVRLELSRTPMAEDKHDFRLAMGVDLVARKDKDYIVHHKITGLEPDTIYYFRFIAGGDFTRPVGRFRTLPASSAEVTRTSFGVLHGIDWSNNYWDGMLALKGNFREMHYLLLLGGAVTSLVPNPGRDGAQVEIGHTELHLPNGEAVTGIGTAAATYADFRYLHQTYRADDRLQQLLSMFTLLPMVGDADLSDDCWGAHETYTNGNAEQRDRLLAALAAWMQYMPLDWGDVSYDPNNTDFTRIRLNRSFRFGNLLNLVLTEQRLQRTDHAISESLPHEPLNLTGPIGSRNLVTTTELARNGTSAQKIVGDGQMSWLKEELTKPGVVWNVIAGESAMLRLPLNLTKEPDYDQAVRREYLLTADGWDGYRVQQTELLDHVRLNGVKNVVSIAGGGVFSASEIWSDYSQRTPVMVECTTGPISGLTLSETIAEQLGRETDTRFAAVTRLFDQSYMLDNLIKPESLGWMKYLNTGTRGFSVVYVLSNNMVIDFFKLAEMTGLSVPSDTVASRVRVNVEAGSLTMTAAEIM